MNRQLRMKIFFVIMQMTYPSLTGKRKEKEVIEHPPSRQCFYCNHFFTKKDVLEKHVKVCSSVTGIAYRFYNQKNRVFSKNFNFMADLLFTVYRQLQAAASSTTKKCTLSATVKYMLSTRI